MSNIHVTRSTSNPAAAPTDSGAHWINTANGNHYLAKGTATVADWVLIASAAAYVPYTGATTDVNLGANGLTANDAAIGTGGASNTIGDASGGSGTQQDNASYNYTANSEDHQIKVWAYKDSGNNRVYSANPLTINFTADSSLNQFRILWAWGAVTGASGYKINVTQIASATVDRWLETASTSFTDDNYRYSWTASNNVVTPASPTPFYSATGLTVNDHAEVKGNLTVGLELIADKATLEEKLVLGGGASRTEINKNGYSGIGKAPITTSNFHIYNPEFDTTPSPTIDTLSLESAVGDTELTLYAGDTTAHGPGFSAGINFRDGTQIWQMSTNLIDVGNNWNWQDSTTSNIPLTLTSIDGFVGINNIAPTKQLEVTGDTLLDGSLTVTEAAILKNSAISASAIDWALGNVFTKTLSANTTFTFSNMTDGQTIVVRLTNTASNYTVTWPTVKWSGGVAPTMTIGAKDDVYTFIRIGSTTYGSAVQNCS
jgi:hypothetical protein